MPLLVCSTHRMPDGMPYCEAWDAIWDAIWHTAWHIAWNIAWHIAWNIAWNIAWHVRGTYMVAACVHGQHV